MNIEPRALYRFAKRAGLPMRELDEGYAIHAALAATFDHGVTASKRCAPKPFHIVESCPVALQVLGYSQADHEQLRNRARAGDARAAGVVELGSLASRPVPAFEKGRKLAFEVRACPVRRVAKRGDQLKNRAEVDVYLAQVRQEEGGDAPPDRMSVYRDWLRTEVQRGHAARVVSVDISGFRLGRQFRRTQGNERKSATTRHPEVHFEGVLEVTDPSAFTLGLARGVGRHRAFGFGMLLLRPYRVGG